MHTLKFELTLSVKRWAVLIVGGAACSYACFELLRLICSYIISYGFAPVFLLEIPILVYGLIFPPALLGWLLYKAQKHQHQALLGGEGSDGLGAE